MVVIKILQIDGIDCCAFHSRYLIYIVKNVRDGAIYFAFLPLIFSHWLGFELTLGYFAFLGLCVLFVLLVKRRIPAHPLLNAIMVIIPIVVIIEVALNYDADNEYFFTYLYNILSIFVLAILVITLAKFRYDNFFTLALLIFYIAFLSLFFEFVAVNFFDISKEYSPVIRYAPAYFEDFMGWHRPFGLTGQFSVNGGILLLSYLLLIELNIARLKHFIMLLLGTFLTLSGQAILSTIIVLSLIKVQKYKSKTLRYALIFLFSVFLLILLNEDLFHKISLNYIMYIFIEKSYVDTIFDLSLSQLLFGAMGLFRSYTEIFLVESVIRYGFILTILFWAGVWCLIRGASIPRVWFIACFLTSLHYPTIFYIEAQLIICMLFVYTISNFNFTSPLSKY